MRAQALAAGLAEVSPGAAADVIVVNTCTVTARADQEARQLIRRLVRAHPAARIVATGCYAQRAAAEVRALPGVSAVLGVGERDERAALIGALAGSPETKTTLAVGPARALRDFRTEAAVHFGRTRALLKIQDGCDTFCSYCIVPYVRGRSRSIPVEEAVARARRLLAVGFREIVLTGADLGSYGKDLGEPGLLETLIHALLRLGDAHRLRISSIEPNKIDPAVVAMVGAEPGLCRHLHLPMQSGSDRVLRAMRRGYTSAQYGALLAKVTRQGTVGIGADVVVGFPGEGDAEFEETYRFLEEAPVTFLHVFRYSARPGTVAACLDAPSDAAARERSERLRLLGESKSAAFRRALVGTTLPVIVEARRFSGRPVATSDVFVPVDLSHTPLAGGIVSARILRLEGNRLIGAPAEAPAEDREFVRAMGATG